MNNGRFWIVIGGIFGFLSVAMGAFGAHILSGKIPAEMIEIYKTGVLYHLTHSIVILGIGLSDKSKYFKPALLFSIGVFLFSFSLYLYAVTTLVTFAFITPIGGLILLSGWLLLVINGIRN